MRALFFRAVLCYIELHLSKSENGLRLSATLHLHCACLFRLFLLFTLTLFSSKS